MKALRWHGNRDVRLDEVPVPAMSGPDELLLRVLFCGLCGTDIEEYRRGPVSVPTRPHPLSGRSAPLTLGHEFDGEVVAVGAEVTQFKPGDFVAVEGNRSCGECFWCRKAQNNLCINLAQYGLMADGGLAEYVAVVANTCQLLPPGLAPSVGALAEPLSCAVRAVRRSRVEPGETVAVIGAGPIGILVTQVLRASGAGSIIVVEPDAGRRELAHRMGATEALNPDGCDVQRALRPDDIGPDIIFECSGHSGAADLAITAVRRGGRAVLVGVLADAHLNLDFLHGEKEIVTSLSHEIEQDFAVGIGLLTSGAVAGSELISEVIDLEAAHRRFFSEVEPGLSRGKVLVAPQMDRPLLDATE